MSILANFINYFAPIILVFMGLGILFGIIRIKSILFFSFFILLLPFLASAINQAFTASFSLLNTWKVWLIFVLLGLLAARIFISRISGR